jgi:hypothetical protein
MSDWIVMAITLGIPVLFGIFIVRAQRGKGSAGDGDGSGWWDSGSDTGDSGGDGGGDGGGGDGGGD